MSNKDPSPFKIDFETPHVYNRKEGTWPRAKEVGSYILDGDEFSVQEDWDWREPKYPKLKQNIIHSLPMDLNDGYESYFYEQDPSNDNKLLENLLMWVNEEMFCLSHEDNFAENISFIASQKIIGIIGETIYDRQRKPWKFQVTKNTDIIYFSEIPNSADETITVNQSEKKASYYDINFTKTMTDFPVDINEHSDKAKFYSVSKLSMLSGILLLCDSEVNTIHPETGRKILMKTIEKSEYYKYDFMRSKLLSAWLESKLSYVETVNFGIRNSDGVLEEIKEYDVSKIPQLCQQQWSSGAIRGFIKSILIWIRLQMRGFPQKAGIVEFKGGDESFIDFRWEGEPFLPAWHVHYTKCLSSDDESGLDLEDYCDLYGLNYSDYSDW